jgi:hypothetical protein
MCNSDSMGWPGFVQPINITIPPGIPSLPGMTLWRP